jgi:hypothetical protein
MRIHYPGVTINIRLVGVHWSLLSIMYKEEIVRSDVNARVAAVAWFSNGRIGAS